MNGLVLKGVNRVKALALYAFAFAAMVTLSAPTASATFTIPDTGVDVGAAITESITSLGAVVLIAVGGYAAFLIVRRAIRWLGVALR